MAMVILPLLLLLLLPSAAAQGLGQVCGNSGNYTLNSTYQANLMLLSSTLPNKTASNATLFATDIVGNLPDMIFALALCRGDTNASVCEGCVATAFQDGPQLCPYSKDVAVYYETCLLRFSNKNFLDNTIDDGVLILVNNQSFTTSVDSMKLLVFTLLTSTAQTAANNSRRFTTSRLHVGSFPTLYCLTQCTPDLTAKDCATCFQDAFEYLGGSLGGRILGTRCNMRYENYQFFSGDPMVRFINLGPQLAAINNTMPGPPATVYGSPLAEQHGRYSGKRVLLTIAVAASLLSILQCFICSVMWLRRRRKAATDRPEEDALVWRLEEKSSEFTLFDFSKILHATCNFSKENLLGKGGFGPVYKGQLQDGMEIAVKRLASLSGQGFTEFKNEVELIAKLQHKNLVKLMGCCIQGEEKLLVYEYLPNKSLDFFIFDGKRTTLVDWNKRRLIIKGIAQGLLYLHEHSRLRIIHRDLKASNILLDQDMNPKISDFGLAKIFSSSDAHGSTKRVVGTYGYMSPEYAYKGIYSVRSDVFSFGVLLLEILSGKKNTGCQQSDDFIDLLGYSWLLWEGVRWRELLEASIAKEIHATEARRYINIALMCVQENANDRPTMSHVVAMLSSECAILTKPNHPGYFNRRVSQVHELAGVAVLCSNNDVSITAEPEGR